MNGRLPPRYPTHPRHRGILVALLICPLMLAAATSRAAAPPALSIDDVEVYETDAGTKMMRFTVAARGAICGPISVGYRVQPGTAAAGADYVASTGTLELQLSAPEFVRTFGEGILSGAGRIARGSDGNLYVLDSGNSRVVRFSREGTYSGQIALPPGYGYTDIASGSGLLYVGHYVNNQVYVIDPQQGIVVNQWFMTDLNGTEPNFGPFGIATAPDGHVYTSDYHRVRRFNSSGSLLASWHEEFEPFGLQVGSDGRLFVGITSPYESPGKVRVYTPEGVQITTWNAASTAGVPYFGQLALDGCGNVWLLDEGRIVVAREDATFLTEWNLSHNWYAHLHAPNGVAFDDEGSIYFTDAPGRISQFEKRAQAAVEVEIRGETTHESDETFTVELFDPVNAVLADASAQGTIVNDDPQFGSNWAPNPSFDASVAGWAPYQGSVIDHVSDGHDAPGAARITGSAAPSTFGINDSEDFVSSTAAGARYRFSGWVKATAGSGVFRMRVREYLNGVLQRVTQTGDLPFDAAWRQLTLPVTALTTGAHLDVQVLAEAAAPGAQFLLDDFAIEPIVGDRAPIVEVPSHATFDWLHPGSVSVTARDPDGDAITGLTFDEASLPPGSTARFTVAPDGTSGVFTWSPNRIDVREDPYIVRFTAQNALSGSSAIPIQVSPNVMGNGSFEDGLEGWSGIQGTTLSRRSPGRIEGHALVVTAPGNVANCGVTDSPDRVRLAGGNEIVHATAWLRSSNSTGKVWLRLREYDHGVFVQQYDSYRLPLTTEWRRFIVGGSYSRAGSTIDLVAEFDPGAAGEEFEMDDVTIEVLGGSLVDTPELTSPTRVAAFVVPNPMRGSGTLRLSLPRPGSLRVDLYDVTGRLVTRLADEANAAAGTRTFALRKSGSRTSDLPAGVYFYRAASASGSVSGRFVILE